MDYMGYFFHDFPPNVPPTPQAWVSNDIETQQICKQLNA